LREKISGILLGAAVLVLLVGIGMKPADRDSDAEKEQKDVTGCIRLAGSSSMEHYVSALAEGFMEKYPDVTVTVEYTGSGAGIAAVTEVSVEIGISSRYLAEEEKARGLTENIVGLNGIAVCVDAANPVRELTRQELADIYRGKIRNWAQAGGENIPIVVIGREAGSGTRQAFEEFLESVDICTYVNELDSTGAVAARVSSTPGAIGYVSFDTLDRTQPKIAALSLDGVKPSAENIVSGSYPLYRPFIMVTKGEVSGQNSLVQLWFSYVYGEEGRLAAEMADVLVIR
jgi:phosphate transport system substrate-binding protein